MKTGAAVLGMLATAAIGAAAAGWIASTREPAVVHEAPLPIPTGKSGPGGFPLGDIAGGGPQGALVAMPNPLGNDPAAVAHGHHLFLQMNCAGCHGYHGKGGMGPDLTDYEWRYGGAPAQIYNTLAEGRPKGMPAWGQALPPELLWELTAYVHSLGGGIPAAQAEAGMHGDYHGATGASGSEKNASPGAEAGQSE